MDFVIGSDVTIKTKWKSNLLGVDFDYNTIKGKVVKNFKWLGSDYVCVFTGNENHPISAIHKKFILGFSKEKSDLNLRVFRITSKSSGKEYMVNVQNGHAKCDCVGFQYRNSCKHSKKVLDKLAERLYN